MNPTLKEIYEIMRQRLEEQNRWYGDLERKAGFLFGSIMIFGGLILREKDKVENPCLFLLGLVVLSLTLAVVLYSLHPRDYFSSPKPAAIVKRANEGKDLDYIFGQSIANIELDYARNACVLLLRGKSLKIGFVLAYIGLVLAGAGFLHF